MYHVLIIDDEILAVSGLKAGVDWDKLSIDPEHVHCAYSVKQGQDIFGKFPIKLLICDIEMPQQTGMDMQEWVRANHPNTLTIFLTCHSDFNYAKHALQLGSFDYLLKPVDYEEMEGVLQKAITKLSELEQKITYESLYEHYRKLWESHRPILAERFWQSLLRRTFLSVPRVIEEQLALHGLEHSPNIKYVPILLKIRRWYKLLNQRDEQIMKYAFCNAALEGLQSMKQKAIAINLDNNQGLIILLHVEADTPLHLELLKKGSKEYIEFCNEHLYCDVSAYIGKRVEIHEVANMADQLVQMDKNNIVQINLTMMYQEGVNKTVRLPDAQWTQWLEWMKEKSEARLYQSISNYFSSWQQEQCWIDAKMVELFYQEFLQMIYAYLDQVGLKVNQVFDQKGLTSQPEDVLRNVNTLEEWVIYIIQIAIDRVNLLQKSMTVVEKVEQFIKENIGQPSLSREEMAKHVYLNPDYLTRIFKRETGMSISDYLQQCRLDYAKRLLKETNQTVSEIALASGYSNISYFSTIFKKITAINPLDYRRLHKVKL